MTANPLLDLIDEIGLAAIGDLYRYAGRAPVRRWIAENPAKADELRALIVARVRNGALDIAGVQQKLSAPPAKSEVVAKGGAA